MAITSRHQRAIETLHDRGARFVLLRNKVAFIKGWPRIRHKPRTVAEHLDGGGQLGVVPYSLGLTGVDVDSGDGRQLTAFPHRAALPTRRGIHIYFDDDRPRRNRNACDAFGARFDIRGSNGYLMFHGDGAVRLADAMETSSVAPLPADLFAAAGVDLPIVGKRPKPRKKVRTGPSCTKTDMPSYTGSLKGLDSKNEVHPIEDVCCGMRNNWLFGTVRNAVMDMADTGDAVAYALDLNRQLSDPLDAHEAERCAVQVIRYEEGYRDGLAGLRNLRCRDARLDALARWHGHAGPDIVAEVASRDARMRRERAEGIPVSEIRKRTNLTERQVRRITAGCRPAKAEPWKELGISRRTWFNRKAEARAADKAAAEAAACKVEHHKPDPTETSALDAALATLQRRVTARNRSPVVDLRVDDTGNRP